MSDSINYPEVGARIRQQREHIGMTQEQLGEACDLSASFVGHIERGSRKLSVESLYKLASVLDVSADYLLFNSMLQETTINAPSKCIIHWMERFVLCRQFSNHEFTAYSIFRV